MSRTSRPVLDVIAPSPRPTRAGAVWLACILSVPVFVVLSLCEIVLRVAF